MIDFLKNIARPFYLANKAKKELGVFEKLLAANGGQAIKLVVGSSNFYEPGWIPTESHFLNLLEEKDWKQYFNERSIQYILAEHVWEHLTLEQGKIAAQTCYKFLKKGGKLRVAVPDGNHSDPEYINYVKPGGHGAGADDHKVLYTFESFRSIFEQAGFKVELLEHFDNNKTFHATDWDRAEGYIQRSIRYDKRNADGLPHYSSLILDAIK